VHGDQRGKPYDVTKYFEHEKYDFKEFGCTLQFDRNNRYLIGFGGRDFFMVDVREKIENNKPLRFRINEFLYKSISSVTVCTDAKLDANIYEQHLIGETTTHMSKRINDKARKVFIAAKRVGVN
jgi:hypothetical protein